jgi:hypothetical protein
MGVVVVEEQPQDLEYLDKAMEGEPHLPLVVAVVGVEP